MSKGGRPTAYDPSYAAQAEKLCKLGATDAEIADFFAVTTTTIWRWKRRHEEFSAALTRGKEVADNLVEESLYRRATGYDHDAVKIFMPAGAEAPVYAPFVEHHPPDTTACIFWLKNRRSGLWRDKQEHTGPEGGPIKVQVEDTELARRIALLLTGRA